MELPKEAFKHNIAKNHTQKIVRAPCGLGPLVLELREPKLHYATLPLPSSYYCLTDLFLLV